MELNWARPAGFCYLAEQFKPMKKSTTSTYILYAFCAFCVLWSWYIFLFKIL